MLEILFGLAIGFIFGFAVGGGVILSDHKSKIAGDYMPYIGKDGTLMWREAPNNTSTELVSTNEPPSEGTPATSR